MSIIKKLGNYKGIEVEINKPEVTEEEVQSQLDMIVAQTPSYEDKETDIVEQGDMTTIDFEGFKDGVAFEGGKGENYQLGIGSGQFIPGFEDGMVGMKKGETRDINVTFPENYGAKDLAGAAVVFKVTVHNIQTKIESVLNDAFVSKLGIPEVETVDQLKDMIKTSLTSQKEEATEQEFENKVFDILVNDSEVEVTEEEIEKAMSQQIQVMRNQLMQSGMQLEQYLEMMGSTLDQLKEQLKPNAVKQAQFEGIIDAIIEKESISTNDQEAEDELDAIAAANNVSKEEVLKQVTTDMIKENFNRLKATRVILENAVNKMK